MASSDVTLLGAPLSPFTNRVQMVLNLKSVHYEFLEESFPFLIKSELLLKSNPVHKKVPVLIHGGKPVNESLVIVQYIVDVWTDGPGNLPLDPYDRAMARFWAAYLDAEWWPLLRGLHNAEGKEAEATALGKFMEGIMLLEDAFAKCGKGKDYFGGDTIGYLDVILGGFLGWLRATEKMTNLKILNATKTPGLFGWAHRFGSNAAVKDVIPETEKVVELAKTFAAIARAQ